MDERQGLLKLFTKVVKDILGEKLTKIIVYGSYARGDYNENSDIDIMILTSLSRDEIRNSEDEIFNLAYELELLYGIHISVIVNNDTHYYYWLGAYPFYDNVQREGVTIG